MQGETGSDAAARISEWVAATFEAQTVGNFHALQAVLTCGPGAAPASV